MSRARAPVHFTSMKSNGNRILAWAIGGSLVAHLVFALVVRSMPVAIAKEQPPTKGGIIHIRMTPPPPTPTPKPQPPQPHHPTAPASRPVVHPPIANNHGPAPGKPSIPVIAATAGPGIGDPGPQVVTSPEPTATPRPACSDPNVAARAIEPISPSIPDDAAGQSGVAQVRVTLTPSGGVSQVDLYRSTGNLSLDRAAVRAARLSSYRAEIRACVPVGGSYLFTVDFENS